MASRVRVRGCGNALLMSSLAVVAVLPPPPDPPWRRRRLRLPPYGIASDSKSACRITKRVCGRAGSAGCGLLRGIPRMGLPRVGEGKGRRWSGGITTRVRIIGSGFGVLLGVGGRRREGEGCWLVRLVSCFCVSLLITN